MIVYEACWVKDCDDGCPEGIGHSQYFSSKKNAIKTCKEEIRRRKVDGDHGFPEPHVRKLELVDHGKKEMVLRCLNKRYFYTRSSDIWPSKEAKNGN